MAYDEALAARVRHSLEGRTDVVEKAMFGGLTFMVSGNMCCGVHGEDLIIRLDRDTVAEDLHSPDVRAWDFMKGPMRGIFAVAAAGAARQTAVDKWVARALKHAVSLPPKVKRAAKPRGESKRAPRRSV
jgi:hypothetical protein